MPPLHTDAWTHHDSLDPRAATSRSDQIIVEFNTALAAVAMRHHELLASLRSINARLRANPSTFAVNPPDYHSPPGAYPSPLPLATDERGDAYLPSADSTSDTRHVSGETPSFPSSRDYNYFDKLDTILAALGRGLLGPRAETSQPSRVPHESTSDQR